MERVRRIDGLERLLSVKIKANHGSIRRRKDMIYRRVILPVSRIRVFLLPM